jgi:NAD(P)H dehydrogenase (quinone)
MNISVILAHPDKHSFNHAIADTIVMELKRNNHQFFFHDLYAENFDPILLNDEIHKDARISENIDKHCKEIARADGIIIVHPNWWGQPPAILKGWVDRVLRPGIAYKFVGDDKGQGVPAGLLKATTALVFNTSNTAQDREDRVFGDPLDAIWKKCIFGLCGVKTVHRETFSVVVSSTPEQRQAWLARTRDIVSHHFPRKTK